MKLFDVCYITNTAKGTALVLALSPNNVLNVLKTYGRLKEDLYKVLSIKECGCNHARNELLLRETFEKGLNDTVINYTYQTVNQTVIEEPRDILYVDRIGTISRGVHTKSPRNFPDDGYTVLRTSCDFEDPCIDFSKLPEIHLGHLYKVIDGKYVDLGIPIKYKEIRSATHSFNMRIFSTIYDLDRQIGILRSLSRTSPKTYQIGIWIRSKRFKGKRIRFNKPRWKFIKRIKINSRGSKEDITSLAMQECYDYLTKLSDEWMKKNLYKKAGISRARTFAFKCAYIGKHAIRKSLCINNPKIKGGHTVSEFSITVN